MVGPAAFLLVQLSQVAWMKPMSRQKAFRSPIDQDGTGVDIMDIASLRGSVIHTLSSAIALIWVFSALVRSAAEPAVGALPVVATSASPVVEAATTGSGGAAPYSSWRVSPP